MFTTIDILLGLSVVMLIASMAATVLTQFITSMLNTRGKHLARGLADLLQQIDPQLERALVEQISRAVLSHPLICHLQGIPLLGAKMGDTIHREEFTKLLMDMAAGQSFGQDETMFPAATRDKLKDLLERNGIDNPAATLDNVRAYALQLEQANPELATDMRHSIALMQEANSRFVAKINSWFDQTIDRVSDRFTASTRIVTLLCSVVVVGALQLDAIDLINRLSMDEQLRNTLVSKAIDINNAEEQKQAAATEPSAETNTPDIQAVKNDLKTLQDLGVINIFGSGKSGWLHRWCELNFIGVLLSVFLVSLGAPFWYNTLKNLLKLRSTLAGKDDEQRNKRQTSQQLDQNTAKPDAAQPDSNLAGERGILG